MAECEEKMGTTIETLFGAFFLLLVLLEFYFFSVVYTHYKNFNKENSPSHHLQDETA